MKLMNFALAFAASLCIFTSCSNEADEIVDVNKDIKVNKIIGIGTQAAISRTAIKSGWDGTDAATVYWLEGDKVTVFAKGHAEGDEFNFKTFTGSSQDHAEFTGKTYQSDTYYILSPAQKDARLVGENIKLNIPDKQKAVLNSFDPSANVLLNKTGSDLNADLLNICAYFCIEVPADCSKVTIKTTNANWYLAGDVTVSNIGSAGNHISSFDSGKSEIELTGFTQAGRYLISFIPTSNMNSGLHLSVNTDHGNYDVDFEQKDGGFNFAAGSYYNLGKFN